MISEFESIDIMEGTYLLDTLNGATVLHVAVVELVLILARGAAQPGSRRGREGHEAGNEQRTPASKERSPSIYAETERGTARRLVCMALSTRRLLNGWGTMLTTSSWSGIGCGTQRAPRRSRAVVDRGQTASPGSFRCIR